MLMLHFCERFFFWMCVEECIIRIGQLDCEQTVVVTHGNEMIAGKHLTLTPHNTTQALEYFPWLIEQVPPQMSICSFYNDTDM